jgi:plasmid stability protein
VPKNVQIRNVPDDVHATLRARAAAAGLSLSDYLRDELVDLARLPTVADVLTRAQARHGTVETATIVRVVREMREGVEPGG